MNAAVDIAGLDAFPLDEDFAPAEARLRALARMTEIGMGRMERLHERGLAETQEDAASSDWSQDYAKIARGVRMNISLEDKLERALRDRRAGLEAVRRERDAKAAEQAAARIAADEAAKLAEETTALDAAWRAANAPRLAREATVDEVMVQIIRREHRGEPEEIERLEREVEERLADEYGGYDDYGVVPVSETVRSLCDELELDPDWDRWAGKAWAIEEAEAGVAGSPYVSRKRGGSGEWVIEVAGADSS